MNKSESNTNSMGELVTLRQACETVNLGANTVRQLAQDA